MTGDETIHEYTRNQARFIHGFRVTLWIVLVWSPKTRTMATIRI